MDLARYISLRDCPTCGGTRLKPESLAVRVGGMNIDQVCRLSILDCFDFFRTLPLSHQEAVISERVLKEIRERLRFLLDVGMDYLNLARSSGTLSGGENQRIRLATQIGSGLMGFSTFSTSRPWDCTSGQPPSHRHPEAPSGHGQHRLVVEHDADMMLSSDEIIDMDPRRPRGRQHRLLRERPEILRSEDSLTGRYLSGALSIPVPRKRRTRPGKVDPPGGGLENNLKNIDIRIPVGVFTAVTGSPAPPRAPWSSRRSTRPCRGGFTGARVRPSRCGASRTWEGSSGSS
jgi:excinuclease ABC subunit A